MTNEWNPRFVAYSQEQGRDPEAQIAHDKAAFPSGCMVPFMAWGSKKLASFRADHPEAFHGLHLANQDAYTAWLFAQIQE